MTDGEKVIWASLFLCKFIEIKKSCRKIDAIVRAANSSSTSLMAIRMVCNDELKEIPITKNAIKQLKEILE